MHTRKEFRQRARIFRTLGNESRLFILKEVSKEALTVSEIAQRLHIRVQNASKHLHRMLAVDLVEGVRTGQSVHMHATRRGLWWRRTIAGLKRR